MHGPGALKVVLTPNSPKQDDKRTRLAQLFATARRFVVHDLLHADDTPHRLALGVAVGMFVAFTPTIPFQMMLTVFLAWVLRANKTIGLPAVWITNPATIVPVYFPQYLLGCWLMGRSPRDVDFSELTLVDEDFWIYADKVWQFSLKIFAPLWAGSLVVALVLAVVSYYVVKALVTRYRLKRYGSLDAPPPLMS